MKKRRLIISLFLIAAVALLAIGYSELTARLDIQGTITSAQSTNDFKVVFTDTPVAVTSNASILCQPTVDATGVDATMNMTGLANNGDSVTCYFKVQNKSKAIQTLDSTLNGLSISVTRNSESGTENETVNDAAGSEGVDKDYLFTGQYIRVEAHFVSSYEYLDGEDTKTATAATGEIGTDGLSAILEAPNSVGEEGEFVYVKVTVTVIGSFTAKTYHTVNVHFAATSDAVATSNE